MMSPSPRPPAIFHCTPEPFRFFGRAAELALLDQAVSDPAISVVALLGLGGQGKTAIVQHWLQTLDSRPLDGLFFWSFYRGKDADLCLRQLYGYAERMDQPPDVSASYCVDHLLPVLRRERWVIILDGAEVVQHESGDWLGRFVHPELARLVEELASEPMPGVLVLTTRFPLPGLERRHHARVVDLANLDTASARELLKSVGVQGADAELDHAASAVGFHAKAVELLGTWLTHFENADALRVRELPLAKNDDCSPEENNVARVLAAFHCALPLETSDILALATAFRQPPTQERLLEYLSSAPLRVMLHDAWKRTYPTFQDRGPAWLASQIQDLIMLRLLERVGDKAHPVIDAHPLVQRGFEQFLGPTGQRHSATARAGFLHGRPDRRPPISLRDAREEVELFHAYCDAGLWNEADSIFIALDNPKHRFLAPAFERDLLVRFFPEGDWRKPPLWDGFGRWRSLAICLEMLGQFGDALQVYRPADAALTGDALIALGQLQPLLERESVPHPWQNLWRAYRAHALCLAGRTDEAVALARSLIPVDIYEWVHVFECLLRAGQLTDADVRGIPPQQDGWPSVVRRRMLLEWRRVSEPEADLEKDYRELVEAFDRGGLPWERALARLGFGRWLRQRGRTAESKGVAVEALEIGERYGMGVVVGEARGLLGAMAEQR
ncbi:MAG TPA: hypothetical protein VE988_21525 [Gemmataceae bacterium]|nr:hypothetical protein [Gemmataceae bacterium]